MPGCCGAPQAIASGATKREVLRGRLGARRDEINAAIEVLLEDGFLAEADGSLTVALAWLPFDGSSEAEKLDSVRHFLDAVSGALLGRFFTTPPDDDAFARVLTFCTPPEELEPTRTALFEAMSEGGAPARRSRHRGRRLGFARFGQPGTYSAIDSTGCSVS